MLYYIMVRLVTLLNHSRVFSALGVILIVFSLGYAGGLPRGIATAGDIALFFLGILLVIVAVVPSLFLENASDKQTAGILAVSLLAVGVLAVGIKWYQQTNLSIWLILIDRVILTLLLLPPTAGIWTGLRETNLQISKPEVATLVVAAVAVFAGGMILRSDFALAAMIYGVYAVASMGIGLALHLITRVAH